MHSSPDPSLLVRPGGEADLPAVLALYGQPDFNGDSLAVRGWQGRPAGLRPRMHMPSFCRPWWSAFRLDVKESKRREAVP